MHIRRSAVASVMVAGLALAACGDSDSGGSGDEAATSATEGQSEATITESSSATPPTVPAPTTSTTVAPATTAAPTTVPEPDDEWLGLVWESRVDPERVNAADVPRPSWQEAGVLWEVDMIAEVPGSYDLCAEEMDRERADVTPVVAATETCLLVQLRWDAPGSPLEVGYAAVTLDSVIRPDSQSVDFYAYENGHLGTVDNGLVTLVPFTPAGSILGFSFAYRNESTDAFEYSDVRWQTPTPDQLRPMTFNFED